MTSNILVEASEVRPLRFFLHTMTSSPLPKGLVARYRALRLPGANLAGTWPRKTLKRKLKEALSY